MDITEVPVTPDSKEKKKTNKKGKKKKVVRRENAESDANKHQEEEKKTEAAAAPAFPPTFSVSEIKNKQRRHFMFMKLKQEKRKVNVHFQAINV